MAKSDPASPPPFSIVNLANAKVFSEDGVAVKMGTLWQKQTAVFIFLRHFACVGCRTHAVQVWNDRDMYQKGGAKIIFIGNGSPDFIKKFKEDLGIEDAPVYTDPELLGFRAAGFKRGFLASLGPAAIANGIRMMVKGNVQGQFERAAGDLWQLGGIIVVRPTGQVAYHYISEVLGDFPPQSDVPLS